MSGRKRSHAEAASGWHEGEGGEEGTTSAPSGKRDGSKGRVDGVGVAGAAAATEAPSTPSTPLKVTVEDAYSDIKWEPMTSFHDLAGHLDDKVMTLLSKFTTPTPIQSHVWPIAIAKRDAVGIAATGSGKTYAFLLPALAMLRRAAKKAAKKEAGGHGGGRGPVAQPRVLVIAPTRELVMQIQAVAAEAATLVGFRAASVYGGVPKPAQIAEVRGANLVMATPGRLLDLVDDGVLDLSKVGYFVLDEADRMLDMGFEKDVARIIAAIPSGKPASAGAEEAGEDGGEGEGGSSKSKRRQTLMFSATWPDTVRKVASSLMYQPVKVAVGTTELRAAASVTQIVEVVEPHDKDRLLLKLLDKYHSSRRNKVLVFALYKKEAARLETFLNGRGWKCVAIQGDMSQDARTRAFEAFKSGRVPLLVATDVAARGLDIPNVEYVINYTFPLTSEDYVHRIGRTGRAGKTGIAHTFFTLHDKLRAGELVNVLTKAGAHVPEALTKFGTHVKKKEHSLYGSHFKASDEGEGGAAGGAGAKAHMKFD